MNDSEVQELRLPNVKSLFRRETTLNNAIDRKSFSIADPDSLLLTQKRIEEIRQQRKDFKVEIVKKYNLV